MHLSVLLVRLAAFGVRLRAGDACWLGQVVKAIDLCLTVLEI